MKKNPVIMFWALFLAGLLAPPAAAGSLRIEIRPDKQVFSSGEPVTGAVTIFSDMPATYPASFRARFFKDGELVRESLTNIPVFLGKTDFKFRDFGLADFAPGHWRIVLSREGTPAASAEAEFTVEASPRE